MAKLACNTTPADIDAWLRHVHEVARMKIQAEKMNNTRLAQELACLLLKHQAVVWRLMFEHVDKTQQAGRTR